MVAYTNPDCLPYWEGSDSPCVNTGTLCEPSNVLCDMAEIVEQRLDEFDALVARVSTSSPIAFVTRDAPIRTDMGVVTTIEFTSVVTDTDNMVNLDIDPTAIRFNHPGLYQVFFSLRGLSNIAVPGDLVQISATMQASSSSPYPNLPSSTVRAQGSNSLSNQFATINAAVIMPFTAGQVITLTCSGGSGAPTDGMTWSAIAMGVAWMGDLPA